MVKIPTGQTSFMFTYGVKVVMPIELSILTVQIVGYNPKENETTRVAFLELIDDLREEASIRNVAYKRDTSYHDKKVRTKQFYIGCLMLRKELPTQKNKRKLSPN